MEDMKYAVIKSGGKQYRVSEGDVVLVERLPLEESKEMSFQDVLMYVSDGTLKLGSPMLEGISVRGKVVEHPRGKKLKFQNLNPRYDIEEQKVIGRILPKFR